MVSVIFPEPDFRTRAVNGTDYIFDPVRKRWLKITPEEWVRQNMIAFLWRELNIPFSLISVEKKLIVGDLNRRFDIVVYRQSLPWLLIECKATGVALNEETISQMLSYVSALNCPFFFITNGNQSYGWQVQGNSFVSLQSFPSYK